MEIPSDRSVLPNLPESVIIRQKLAGLDDQLNFKKIPILFAHLPRPPCTGYYHATHRGTSLLTQGENRELEMQGLQTLE